MFKRLSNYIGVDRERCVTGNQFSYLIICAHDDAAYKKHIVVSFGKAS